MDIVALYENGMSLKELERHTKTSMYKLRKQLQQANVVLRTQRESCAILDHSRPQHHARKILDDKEWLLNEYITQNKSIENIARSLQVSPWIVKEYINKFDFNKKQHYRQTAEDLYNQGLTYQEIQQQTNISTSALSIILNDSNITIRNSNSYDRNFKRISKAEQEIFDFIVSLNKSPTQCNRTILNGQELDIVVDKLAIEYNGLLYHTEEYNKGYDYHRSKTKKCEQQGFELFHIFEDQWKYKRTIVESMICSKLGIITNKVYARQCIIKQVDKDTRINFFENNHLQGRDSATIAYGLYCNQELVACMSFSPMKYNKALYDYELVRYASLLNMQIVGGFSRLVKHFQKNHFGSIISYSDNSYSQGRVYQANGFEFVRETPPGYSYYDGKLIKRQHRSLFTRKRLMKLLNTDQNYTERELASQAGLKRIWNCGMKVWIKKEL